MDPRALEMLRRQRDLELIEDGTFIFRGAAVAHPRVQALFHRGVEVREDGEVLLRVGGRWCYLPCRGVAHFVERLHLAGGALAVRLAGGQDLTVALPLLAVGPDDRFYVWAGDPLRPARLMRDAHQALAGLLDVGDRGEPCLTLGAARVAIARLAETPGPAAPPPDAFRL